MAGFKYTKEQEQVINTRKRNLLVSASAGSGKTAVLVQRIIEMVSNKEEPIDIDKLLIVTFTNAAAAEMKHRIGEALENKIEAEPENKHLQNQYVLLNHANIMTIHAFCLSVIKTYYNQIQLDPSFRIGDSIEIELLKKQVLENLLEEKYEENDVAFIDFVDAYASGKTDQGIEEIILNLYRFATSNLWPIKWLYDSLELLKIDEENYESSIYFKNMKDEIKKSISSFKLSLLEARNLCLVDNGPEVLIESVEGYETIINELENRISEGYESLYEVFAQFKGLSLSRKRKGFDPDLLKKVKTIINGVKDGLVDLKDNYFYNNLEIILHDINETYFRMEQLVKVVESFYHQFSEMKREKNIIDFNDIEHFSLRILVDEEGQFTDVAKEYKELFEEILIDEYQDSNIIQETILTAISKESMDQPNVFMVGDVKQSIYKFRLAKPELFMGKYNTYSKEEAKYQLINLYRNFRSRKTVIDSINYTFSNIMSEDIGDLTYDEEVYLYNGAKYEDTGDDYTSEVLIFDTNVEDSEEGKLKAVEIEAIGIGQRINELIDSKMKVYDKEADITREVMYKDIVILLRSAAKNVEVFVEALGQKGIPVHANSDVGYFETVEIEILLNLLKIIDNPRQDIPLVSVLRSPIVGLNEDELSIIRDCFNNAEYYMALTTYLEGSIEETELFTKVNDFLFNLSEWRRLSKLVGIDDVIYKIFDDTGFDQYVTLMPNGLQRKANIDMFVQRAASYEKTSFRGVFNFVQYIEKMKRYSMDMGEALVGLENENLVKIMTIHKSKGLEFPVVFVARLDKRFNTMDLNKRIVFHQDIGIGADYINHIERYSEKTLPKTIISNKNKRELLSEEMRIFYVALTRAREKLILSGVVKDFEQKLDDITAMNYEGVLLAEQLSKVNTYMDWILWGVLLRWDSKEYYKVDVRAFNPEHVEVLEGDKSLGNLLLVEEEIETLDEKEISKLLYAYPYAYANNYGVTMSVSDVKRRMEEETESTFEKTKEIPIFMGDEKSLSGADKGTIYHKVMYHLDLDLETDNKSIEAFIDNLVIQKVITKKEKSAIKPFAILKFLKSDLCQRMKNNKGLLRKETPFVIGLDLNEMFEEVENKKGDEMVMLQGVIDAFFLEVDGLVLVDYKTDYIPEGNIQSLIEKYKTQMIYYKRALESITDLKVKEIVLYALGVGQEVILPSE